MVKKNKTEAIIFKKKDLLNKDLLITFFTKEKGKINILAKGIKKITSKRLSCIQTGNLVQLVIEKRKDFYYLSEISLISGFLKIKENKNKLKFLYQYLIILDKLLPENQKELVVYNLTKKFLIDLSKKEALNSDSLKKLFTIYLNKILSTLGYINKNYSFKELMLIIEDLVNDRIISFDI